MVSALIESTFDQRPRIGMNLIPFYSTLTPNELKIILGSEVTPPTHNVDLFIVFETDGEVSSPQEHGGSCSEDLAF